MSRGIDRGRRGSKQLCDLLHGGKANDHWPTIEASSLSTAAYCVRCSEVGVRCPVSQRRTALRVTPTVDATSCRVSPDARRSAFRVAGGGNCLASTSDAI